MWWGWGMDTSTGMGLLGKQEIPGAKTKRKREDL